MRIMPYASDKEILTEIGNRIKDLRISMNINQRQLSDDTAISLRTISNLENGKDVSLTTLLAVLRALNQLSGIENLVPEQSVRPSQILELGKKRERVSSIGKDRDSAKTNWKWGDEK